MVFGWSPRAVRQARLACHSYAPLPLAISRPVPQHTPWRFTLRDSQKYEGVGQASSRLAVVSRAGAGVGLFALHTGIRRQRINGSRVTLDSRFDTPTVEAEGVPP